ncbi:unnamed protein product [Camellia sinensis]
MVKFCGNGTLAASQFLFTSGLVNVDKIEFLTLFGVLIAKRVLESQDCVLIDLDLPIVPPSDFDSAKVPSISKALSGASVIDLNITTTEKDLIGLGRAVNITGLAPPGSGFDFFSLVFGPKMGINEDLMGKTPVKYCVVDAFTDSPFKGNPAAVCLLEEERDDDEWFQTVASEFNLPITCFLTRITDSESEAHDSSHSSTNSRFRLRWFIPAAEIVRIGDALIHHKVKLCGHGTLAASHFLFTSGLANANRIEFLTLSGVLIAKRVAESQDCFLIELDFPIVPLADFDSAEVPSISKTLSGASVIDLKITTTEEDLIVVLPSGNAVTDLLPQFDEIQRCPGRAVIITGLAPHGSGFDFFSRVFGPKMGINEDIVTGTAHCALAGYWSKKLGKCDFAAYQASARGGILNLHLDEKTQRVLLQGKAITVMEGSLLV